MKALTRYIFTYLRNFPVAYSSTMLFENVCGLKDRKNTVLCRTPSNAQLGSVAKVTRNYEGHVVFFPGDVQNFEKSMQEQPQTKEWTAWSFEKVAMILSDKFPKSYVWVIAPSKHIYKTFSIFQNFVKSESLFGIPSHDDSHGGMLHLQLLLQNSIEKLVQSDIIPPGHNSDLLNNYSINLIGFSKGCIVLNQFLHEVASMQSSTTEAIEDGTDITPSCQFLNRIRAIYWLDGGHSGEKEIWVTKREILSCLRHGCWRENVKIFIHVTPYQIKDKVHPWKGDEEAEFVSALSELGIDFIEKVHFDDGDQDQDKEITVQKHFKVLEVF